ncbi:hypothetical protein [Methylobacterium segetis]|uniref:hypothetical protein n=1 Tax=Methylobacterium segetis TaxID=2488750 RepID=UPI00140470E5|nr:hypothetical protein [Methylobacterium segetis]
MAALVGARGAVGEGFESSVREVLPVAEELLVALDQGSEFGVLFLGHKLGAQA